jgi:hypothetical protein
MIRRAWARLLATTLAVASPAVYAHDGPPFPILSDQVAGPYLVSIWTDPDTTDDGSAGGQFWVRLHSVSKAAVPSPTRATVTIKPLDRNGADRTAPAAPVRGDVTNQFAAVVMDHEGRFAVQVRIDGPLGVAAVDATVDATYGLRPAPVLVLLYVAPFVLLGLLWGRLLIRRQAAPRKR